MDGREPILATKGVMVQVPYRTLYQIENVGTEPALRFKVNVTRARKLYPMDEAPVPVAGFDYVKTRVTGGRGVLDPQNRPVVDFNKVVAGEERGGAFVTDDRSFANSSSAPIESRSRATRATITRKAANSPIMSARFATTSRAGAFEADEGDVVYVPRRHGTWRALAGRKGCARAASP